MTEIEVRDPDPEDDDELEDEGGPEGSPYQNLFVPLIVVPAMIVIVLVLVFVLFGAIAGEESSPQDNLNRMVQGGANESKQAAFNLVRQLQENLQVERANAARELGELDGEPEELPWVIDATMLPQVHAAWNRFGEDAFEERYVLALLLHHLDDDSGLERIEEMLGMPDTVENAGQNRYNLLIALGLIGDPETAAMIRPFLADEDPGLALAAALALQRMPGEENEAALREVLGASDLALRGQAAISLSHLGDPTGADVLRAMLEPEVYEAERAVHPERWTKGVDVRRARMNAAAGLVRLGLPEDRELLERMSREDADPEVRGAILDFLRDAEVRAGGANASES